MGKNQVTIIDGIGRLYRDPYHTKHSVDELYRITDVLDVEYYPAGTTTGSLVRMLSIDDVRYAPTRLG